jgi:hypothetical protein
MRVLPLSTRKRVTRQIDAVVLGVKAVALHPKRSPENLLLGIIYWRTRRIGYWLWMMLYAEYC